MKNTKIAILFMVLLFTVYAVNASTINITPDNLNFEKVLLGGYAEKTITITTDSPDFLFITPAIEGEIKDWITLSPNASSKISREIPLQLKIVVKPPKDVDKGKYTGHIRLDIINKKVPEISVDREIFLRVKTIVETTDKEIKKLEIKDIFVSSTEQDQPIDFFITTLNGGNVELKPVIKIKLANKLHVTETVVFPLEEKEILISLDSKGLELGRHLAGISIFLDNFLIKEETFAFNILKKGSLIRKGVFLGIVNKERVHIKDNVKIDSYFRNTGEISVYAQFKGKVYHNSNLIDEVESKKVYVPVGKTIILNSYFTPNKSGMHKIIGKTFYSTTITEEKESFVDIRPKSESLEVVPLGINPLVLVFLTLLVLIVTHIYLRKKISIDDKTNLKWP